MRWRLSRPSVRSPILDGAWKPRCRSDGRATTTTERRGNRTRRSFDRKKILIVASSNATPERASERALDGREVPPTNRQRPASFIVQREQKHQHREITRTSRKRRGNKRYRCVDDRAIRCARKLNIKESNRTARRSVAREED